MFHFDRIQQRLLLIVGAGIILLSGILVYRGYERRADSPVGTTQQLWISPTDEAQQKASASKQGNQDTGKQPSAPLKLGEPAEDEEDKDKDKDIKVYITGRVKSPGLITLSEGDRVADAIELAGGALPDADLNRINLALRVKDEDMIYVPAAGEEIPADTPALSADNGTGRDGKININKADQALLETLNGIGPAKAQKIIEYRDANGGFKTIEEIMNVSGIGEKTFDGLKGQIDIN